MDNIQQKLITPPISPNATLHTVTETMVPTSSATSSKPKRSTTLVVEEPREKLLSKNIVAQTQDTILRNQVDMIMPSSRKRPHSSEVSNTYIIDNSNTSKRFKHADIAKKSLREEHSAMHELPSTSRSYAAEPFNSMTMTTENRQRPQNPTNTAIQPENTVYTTFCTTQQIQIPGGSFLVLTPLQTAQQVPTKSNTSLPDSTTHQPLATRRITAHTSETYPLPTNVSQIEPYPTILPSNCQPNIHAESHFIDMVIIPLKVDVPQHIYKHLSHMNRSYDNYIHNKIASIQKSIKHGNVPVKLSCLRLEPSNLLYEYSTHMQKLSSCFDKQQIQQIFDTLDTDDCAFVAHNNLSNDGKRIVFRKSGATKNTLFFCTRKGKEKEVLAKLYSTIITTSRVDNTVYITVEERSKTVRNRPSHLPQEPTTSYDNATLQNDANDVPGHSMAQANLVTSTTDIEPTPPKKLRLSTPHHQDITNRHGIPEYSTHIALIIPIPDNDSLIAFAEEGSDYDTNDRSPLSPIIVDSNEDFAFNNLGQSLQSLEQNNSNAYNVPAPSDYSSSLYDSANTYPDYLTRTNTTEPYYNTVPANVSSDDSPFKISDDEVIRILQLLEQNSNEAYDLPEPSNSSSSLYDSANTCLYYPTHTNTTEPYYSTVPAEVSSEDFAFNNELEQILQSLEQNSNGTYDLPEPSNFSSSLYDSANTYPDYLTRTSTTEPCYNTVPANISSNDFAFNNLGQSLQPLEQNNNGTYNVPEPSNSSSSLYDSANTYPDYLTRTSTTEPCYSTVPASTLEAASTIPTRTQYDEKLGLQTPILEEYHA